mmetsp:Transcript_31581/g.100225  ORF Transcript_31581/g.100225 Transcript_31581/m.100225 type:complete len:124 (-) Transcript_31581:397-768(-)
MYWYLYDALLYKYRCAGADASGRKPGASATGLGDAARAKVWTGLKGVVGDSSDEEDEGGHRNHTNAKHRSRTTGDLARSRRTTSATPCTTRFPSFVLNDGYDYELTDNDGNDGGLFSLCMCLA